MKKRYTHMPIMVKQSIHWDRTVPFIMLNEEWAQKNHGQTLQRLAERGGLGACETLAIIEKREWKLIPTDEALVQLIKKIEEYNK